jgi:GNAT superfamily N-acetyltransferase
VIEVRTFEGGSAEAAAFTTDVWRRSFLGKVPLPVWDEPYFDWQLFGARAPEAAEYRVAAYDGARVVGTLFAEPLPFKVGDREERATCASWLTVDPDQRGHGVARKLADELRRRHRERDAAFCLGFGVEGTMGPRFWREQEGTRFLGTVGFWVCLFEPAAVARWTPYLSERLLLSVLGPALRRSPAPAHVEGIRPYRPGDLPECLALARGLLRKADVGCAYTAERLGHQLQYRGLPRTLVLEQDGRVRGLVNFYGLRMVARGEQQVGVIDVMAFDDALPVGERRRLLRAAMGDMWEQGAKSAVLLRLPCFPSNVLWGAGWVPMPGSVQVVCAYPRPGLELPPAPRLLAHWR